MKLAIFGSASKSLTDYQIAQAQRIGTYAAENDITILTGGSQGIPAIAVKAAKSAGGSAAVYSHLLDSSSHDASDATLPLEYFDEHYFADGYVARSMEMIQDADAALVINGRIGTLSEFTIAIQEQLPTGVLEGSGGIADHIKDIIALTDNDCKQYAYFGADYEDLIDTISS